MTGILRDLRRALTNVSAEIRGNAELGAHIDRGLSGEGFAGGYRQALYDVEGALRGFPPTDSRYWPRPEK